MKDGNSSDQRNRERLLGQNIKQKILLKKIWKKKKNNKDSKNIKKVILKEININIIFI